MCLTIYAQLSHCFYAMALETRIKPVKFVQTFGNVMSLLDSAKKNAELKTRTDAKRGKKPQWVFSF